jgi:two-component system, cell cycle sensor histidine kinase and response regulator CckA
VSNVTTNMAGSRTILVVDDEPDVLRLVEAILTEQGYDVVVAKGSDNAIRTFERMPRKPSLVLTDVVMPGMSGPMMVDHMLSIEPNLRVLFMSGYDDRQVVRRYVVEKGFALIAKPFTLQGLASSVREILDLREASATAPGTALPSS